MDWPATIPYLVAALAFAQWPFTWLVVVVVAVCSVFRGRAALTAGLAAAISITLLVDEGIAGPHLSPSNYGHVMAAGAMLAMLLLPRTLWPAPDAPAPEPRGGVRRGLLELFAAALLFGAFLAIEHATTWVDVDYTDMQISLYTIYLLLLVALAARWTARGIWRVTAPLLADRARLRRGTAAFAVFWLLDAMQDDRTVPYALRAGSDLAAMARGAPAADPDFNADCARVAADVERASLHLAGKLCEDTPAAFDATHAAHPTIRRIVLDSQGGLAYAGLALAQRFKDLGFDTRVDHWCASACVIAFLGGHQRQVGADGALAVHQTSAEVWAEGDRRVRWPLTANNDIVAFLRDRGLADEFLRRAEETAPDHLDILDADDLRAYGVAEPASDPPWLPMLAPSPTEPHEATP
jgi:hypothetical protein